MASSARKSREFKIGDKVKMVLGKNKDQVGIVRFIGETQFGKASGNWLGIELDHKTGKNDGSVQGVSYFKCKPGFGLFAKPSMVRRIGEKSSSTTRSSRVKKSSTTTTTAKKSSSSSSSKKKSSSNEKKEEVDNDIVEKVEDNKPILKKQNSLIEQAANAAADANRAEARAQARQDKKDNKELESLRSQLKAAKDEVIATKSKLKLVQQTVIQLKQAEHKGGSANKELQDELQELKDTLEEMQLEKEIAEETGEELQEEIELLKEQLKTSKLEVQLMKQRTERAAEDAIGNLPEGEQEMAKLVQQNRTLTDALRQLRDLMQTEKNRFALTDQQQKRQLEKLSADSEQLKQATKDLEQAKADVEELKEKLDEAEGFHELVEELSEKNVTLGEKVTDLEHELSEAKELLATVEETEEMYQENEEALTADLEAEQTRSTQLLRDLKLAEVKIQDYERAIQNFRVMIDEMKQKEELLVKENAENMNNENISNNDDTSRSAMSRTLKLHNRINEFRSQAVHASLTDIDSERLKVQIDYLKSYIPENLKIDQTSMLLLTSIKQMEAKSLIIQQLMEKFYGADVGETLSSESGPDPISILTARVEMLILDIRSALLTLHTCLSNANETDYETAANRFKSLDPVNTNLDSFITLIAQDRINEVTPLEPLENALSLIRKFSSGYFSKMTDDRESIPPNDILPRVDLPVATLMSVQRLFSMQHLINLYISHIDTIIRKHNPPKEVYKLFDNINEVNIKVKTMVKGAVKFAEAIDDKSAHATDKLDGVLKKADNIAKKIPDIIKNVSQDLRSSLISAGANVIGILQEKLEQMSDKNQQESLCGYLNIYLHILARVNTELEATMTGGGVKISLFGQNNNKPMWEVRADIVRNELMEASQLKFRLEESKMHEDEKASELYKAQKYSRELQTKIEVLQQRLEIVEEQAGSSTELKAMIAKYERNEKENQKSMEIVQRDLEKLSRDNAALKKKLTKLSINKVSHARKDARHNTGDGTHTSLAKLVTRGDAIDSIEMLAQTVRSLRHQLGTITSIDVAKKLSHSLPPLPDVKKPRIHAVSHHTFGDNLATVAQQERLAPDSALGKRLNAFSGELGTVSDKLWNERANPILVDLSKMKKDRGTAILAGGEYLEQQHRRVKLQSDANYLRKELIEFVSEENGRSTQVHPKLPAIASQSSRIGRVIIPHGSLSYSTKVTLDKQQMSNVFKMFI